MFLLQQVRLDIGGKFNIVQCDNGGEFIAREVKEYIEKYGGKIIFSAVYHPQTNGAVERVNRMVLYVFNIYFRNIKNND